MKKVLALIIVLSLFAGCGQSIDNTISESDDSHDTNYISIKYRDTKVDLNNGFFEYLDTSKSSWIKGGWYDEKNEYMIINLEGVYYHYCEMPEDTWDDFESSDSFGSYYHKYVKGNYDCRYNYVPSY